MQEIHISANELVGNTLESPVLEITLLGPIIEIEGNCQIAITGANLSPKVNQQEVSLYTTLNLKSGDVLSFGAIKNGCRAYIAIGGDLQIPKWLGSFSALPYSGKAATPNSLIEKGTILEVATSKSISSKKVIIINFENSK